MKTKILIFCSLFITIIGKSQQQFQVNYTSNPSIIVTTNMGEAELAVATCDGCFSALAKPQDVVLRSNGQQSGNIIIAARSRDGIIFSTGDGNSDTKRMEILNNGKITIGNVPSTPNAYKLYVEGGILAERLKVAVKSSSDWADYVFNSEYKLLPLPELKAYIASHSHLPDIPSASEVVENGLDVAEMDAKLLKKIEELILYVIQLQERIELLEKQVEQNNNSTTENQK